MQGNRVFLDTNIVIYAYDLTAGKKHEIAKSIMADLWETGRGIVSTQVLQEFFVAVTGKIRNPLGKKDALGIIQDLLKWDVVINDGVGILEAIHIHITSKFSFWDSLVIASAVKGRSSVLYSEDLAHAQQVRGVKIVNPFVE